MTLSKSKSINHGSSNTYVNSNYQECADCSSRSKILSYIISIYYFIN